MTATPDGRTGLPERIAQRYRVVRELGRGGMASVYEVVEEATARRLAVKQLHAHRAEADPHQVRLFELEFHTLTQLAHPRVVEVYDYHTPSDGACYSMELLDGGDLREQPALPWRQVCALLCDVCSALSLLHSRRLVHRDVTPRNIRLTHDGKAKLIDFGAMVPFGTHKHPVGTPSFTAPEVVHGQPLDGRADLFSLGATAYYALTGRHAYPSRNFAHVRNAWRTLPALPSRYVEDIPPELDQLVMALLSLPVTRRPASAAAVIERLTALADLHVEEQLLVQRSFLSTPTLVGRDAELQQIRRQTIQAARGRGSVLFVTGPRGIGRSRMVNACALEAKLASATLLRADASDARDGEWGGVRSLLDQLSSELPGQAEQLIAPHARALAQVWPRAGAAPEPERAVVHGALLKLMLDVAHHSFLVVTADDLAGIDEPTRAFVVLLAQQVSGRRMLIVTAAAMEDVADGIRGLGLLQREANTLVLQTLSLAESERLLISMFGDVRNVRMLASRLHEVSHGSPATTMQLCQHLLDREIVSFRDGSWLLPATLENTALPNSLTDALRARLALLSAPARSLGRAMALSAQPSLDVEQCRQLVPEDEQEDVLLWLDALIAADVVRPFGERFVLSQQEWTEVLLAELDPAERKLLHVRVAQMLLQQPKLAFRAAEHLLECGRELEAIELLLGQLTTGQQRLWADPASLAEQLRQLPANWITTVEQAARAAVRLGLPRTTSLSLQLMMLQRLAIPTLPRCDIAREVVHQLYADSGLRDYAELTAVPEPERLGQAYARAQARYDATPEHERGLPPSEAISQLTRLHVVLIGMVGAASDLAFLRELPALTPFAPLSPAIQLVQRNVECSCHMFAGQLEQAHAGYLEILERMDAADGAGLTSSVHRYMRLAIIYAIAVVETTTGRASAAERVNLLVREPLFEVNAWRLRSNWALRQGNTEISDGINRRVELLRISNAPSQFFEGTEAWYEAVVFAEIGDVPRLRTTLSRLDRMGAAFRNWRAAPLFARGQIQLLRGDSPGAVVLFEQALAMSSAGEVNTWARTARGLVEALVEAGRASEARVLGARLLSQALDAGLTVQCIELYFALAAAELAAGDGAAALAQLQNLDALRERWPIGDTFGGKCLELRARLALAAGDLTTFEIAARECNAIYTRSKNPILIGRYQRLVQDAERTGFRASASLRPRGPEDLVAFETERTRKLPRRFELADCQSSEERAQRVLAVVAEQAAARHVMLYLLRGERASLVAATESCPVDERMHELVSEFLQQELENSPAIDPDDVITTTVDNSGWTGPTGVQFVPALLAHPVAAQLAVTGVLVFDIEGHTQPSDEVLARLSAALSAAGDVDPLLIDAAPVEDARASGAGGVQ